MADYVKKIKDLLALAESPNEHEARAALLKARELMAKHKISDAQLNDLEKQEVIKNVTGITFSMRRDPWINELSHIISEHHCCRYYNHRIKGKQTVEVGFIGLSDDFNICKDIFLYAIDCIRTHTDKLRKQYGVKTANGYGFGFALGLAEAYDKQQKEENWALVLTVPEAVSDAIKGMKKQKSNRIADKIKESDAAAFKKGIDDGHKFHEQKRIK